MKSRMHFSVVTILLSSICVSSVTSAHFQKKWGERTRRQDGEGYSQPHQAPAPHFTEISKPEFPALYEVPNNSGDQPRALIESNLELESEPQISTTEPNFLDSTLNPTLQAPEERISDNYAEINGENAHNSNVNGHNGNFGEPQKFNQFQTYERRIPEAHAEKIAAENLERRNHNLALRNFAVTQTDHKQFNSFHPLDQQQVENSFHSTQEPTFHHNQQHEQPSEFAQYPPLPQPMRTQYENNGKNGAQFQGQDNGAQLSVQHGRAQFQSHHEGAQFQAQRDGALFKDQQNGVQFQDQQNGVQFQDQQNGVQFQDQQNGAQYPVQNNGAQFQLHHDGAQFQAQRNGAQPSAQHNGAQLPAQHNGAQVQAQHNGAQLPHQQNAAPFQAKENEAQFQSHHDEAQFQAQRNGAQPFVQHNGAQHQAQHNGAQLPAQYDGAQFLPQHNAAQVQHQHQRPIENNPNENIRAPLNQNLYISDMDMEGLQNHIVDGALLDRVQQIIEEHDRQQKAFLTQYYNTENPVTNRIKFQDRAQNDFYQNDAPSRSVHPAYVQQQQPQQQPRNLFRETKTFPQSPNLEFQPSILSGYFSETGTETVEPRTRGKPSSHENKFQNENSENFAQHVPDFQHSPAKSDFGPPQTQYSEHSHHNQNQQAGPQIFETPRNQVQQKFEFSEERGEQFPISELNSNQGNEFSPNHDNFERTEHSNPFPQPKSQEFFPQSQSHAQNEIQSHQPHQFEQSQNNGNGFPNPNVITRTIVIHEQPTASPDISNRVVISGNDNIRDGTQYQNPAEQNGYLSASAQFSVGDHNRQQIQNGFTDTQASLPRVEPESEEPRPVYGVPIAPVLGPESLDDSVVIDAAKVYNALERSEKDGFDLRNGAHPPNHDFILYNSQGNGQHTAELNERIFQQNSGDTEGYGSESAKRRRSGRNPAGFYKSRNVQKRFSSAVPSPLAGFFTLKASKV